MSRSRTHYNIMDNYMITTQWNTPSGSCSSHCWNVKDEVNAAVAEPATNNSLIRLTELSWGLIFKKS